MNQSYISKVPFTFFNEVSEEFRDDWLEFEIEEEIKVHSKEGQLELGI